MAEPSANASYPPMCASPSAGLPERLHMAQNLHHVILIIGTGYELLWWGGEVRANTLQKRTQRDRV